MCVSLCQITKINKFKFKSHLGRKRSTVNHEQRNHVAPLEQLALVEHVTQEKSQRILVEGGKGVGFCVLVVSEGKEVFRMAAVNCLVEPAHCIDSNHESTVRRQ